MDRRHFLLTGLSLSLTACLSKQDIFNQCLDTSLPPHIKDHPWYKQAWKDIDPQQLWDSHVHLLGNGNRQECWINPKMQSWLHPLLYTQFKFYLNASCVKTTDPEQLNKAFIQRLKDQLDTFPKGARLMLMAFDYTYDEQGKKRADQTPYYISNQYAAKVANQFPDYFKWIGSVHPYRHDAVDALEKAIQQGAKAIKWLPPVMGIDPLSPKCIPFYQKMAKHNIALLSHSGEEKAVYGRHLPDVANPLRLRAALDQGVRVIVAHCGDQGDANDLDRRSKKSTTSFELFTRLMDDPQYNRLLHADISALTLRNRSGDELKTIIQRQDWHPRLLNASDYPLVGVVPLFSLSKWVDAGLLDPAKVDYLLEVQHHNALLFDFLLKRHLSYNNKSFLADTFMTRRHFK